MKHVAKFIFVLLFIFLNNVSAQEDELRGVWIAWAGKNIPSKVEISQMMEDIAEHNMNAVYVDVWRYSYPYYRSQVYYDLTGYWTDPALAEGRDVLEDMIAEAHRVGLQVEAWFEYGFVACQGDADILFQLYPDWFARKKDGSVLFNGDYRYKWLSHCHPRSQQFLIDLAQEVALKYDIDGIEMDRIRYPELNCGYDQFTVNLYKQEHNGNEPPQNTNDSAWMRWRADKLTEFMHMFYDSIKAVRPDIPISNAPIIYPYGYYNFCQDWRPWINQGHLDFVTPQVYRAAHSSYLSELTTQLTYVNDKDKFYPGLTSIANQYLVPTNEIVKMVRTTRNKNLSGHVIWYYNTLADDLPTLKNEVYQQKVNIPNRPPDWRKPAIIVNETDSNAIKTSGWTEYTTLSGFEGGCLYTTSNLNESLEYYANIEESGLYELYCFNIYHWNATRNAHYEIFHQDGIDTVLVNQNKAGTVRWFKIGDYYFNEGESQRLVRLSNNHGTDRILFADAIMVLNTNRPQQIVSHIDSKSSNKNRIADFTLFQNYPNPFNAMTTIRFHLKNDEKVVLNLFDVQGRKIKTLLNSTFSAGDHHVVLNAKDIVSGLYFFQLIVNQKSQIKKTVFVK